MNPRTVAFECLQVDIAWSETPPPGIALERAGSLEGTKMFFHRAEARYLSPIEFLWAWAVSRGFEAPDALMDALFDPAQAAQFTIVARDPEAVDFAFAIDLPEEPFLVRTNAGERPFTAVQLIFRATRPAMN